MSVLRAKMRILRMANTIKSKCLTFLVQVWMLQELQKWERAAAEAEAERKRVELATKIQCMFRSHEARAKVRALRLKARSAAQGSCNAVAPVPFSRESGPSTGWGHLVGAGLCCSAPVAGQRIRAGGGAASLKTRAVADRAAAKAFHIEYAPKMPWFPARLYGKAPLYSYREYQDVVVPESPQTGGAGAMPRRLVASAFDGAGRIGSGAASAAGAAPGAGAARFPPRLPRDGIY